MCFCFTFTNSDLKNKKDISTFARGAILGMMVIGDPEYYNPNLGEADAWVIGKVVYKILEVMRLPQELVKECNGFVGTFFVDNDVENAILEDERVAETILQWNRKYGSMLEAPYDANEKRSETSEKKKSKYKGLSVKQPFLEAIMDGYKKGENRSRAIIPLKGSDLEVRDFKNTLCRFCPNGNAMVCTNILHIGVTKYNKWKAQEKLKMVKKQTKKQSIGFKCNYPHCDSVFELRSEITRHNDQVHGYPKPYQCKVCYRKFGSRAVLKKHLKGHTSIEYYTYGRRRHLLQENDSSIKNLFNIGEAMVTQYESNGNGSDKNSSVEIDITNNSLNEKNIEMINKMHPPRNQLESFLSVQNCSTMNVSKRAKAQYAAAQNCLQR